ncbi:MAG TPA: hypothetical protein VF884_10740 [Nitrososphaeraceae archaeon]
MTITREKEEEEDKFDFMDEKWKKEQKCYDDVKVTGKDWHGKKVTISWPRDTPQEQLQYEAWLNSVKDPDTGEFYHQRDKDGNIIKGTGPQHIVKTIVRVRTSDDKEHLYSNGYLVSYSVTGDPVRVTCSNPETWNRTEFEYKREYDPKSGAVKSKPVGPNHVYTVYEMPFNQENVKKLYDKGITAETLKLLRQTRMGENVVFCLKDLRNNTTREVKDPTGIVTKTLELFSTKSYEYLYNGDYISPQQKAELRQRAVDLGILPPVQVSGTGQEEKLAKPRTGTYT